MKNGKHRFSLLRKNQQNNPQFSCLAAKEHAERISGWDNDRPLGEQNLNTYISKMNSSKQKPEFMKSNLLQNYVNQYIKKHRSSNSKDLYVQKIQNDSHIFQRESHILDFGEFQQSVQKDKKQKQQLSHIERLKEEVKCLQNQQYTKSRFPDFQRNISVVSSVQFQQMGQIHDLRRKLRTQSTRRKSNSKQFFSRKGNKIQMGSTPQNNSNKFNKTMSNQIYNSNGLLTSISEQFINQLKIEINSVLTQSTHTSTTNSQNKNQNEQPKKTIHCCKNESFVKYFKQKKHMNKKNNSNLNSLQNVNKTNTVSPNLRPIQGRKLYQLLNSNRRKINFEIEMLQ